MRIAVFCSARSEMDPAIFAAAGEFARGLAERKWQLIYGGAKVGLMGHFADECLKAGGTARGAITRGLAEKQEMPHPGLQELVVVEDLFDRKRWMMDNADAFVVFPGGFGTLDEALEAITWKALGCHTKPVVFVNVGGFWQSQLKAFQDISARGMIEPGLLNLFEVLDILEEVWAVLDGGTKGRKV